MTSAARRRRPGRLLPGYFVVLLALLYLPIGILMIFSFNSGTSVSFPIRGLTLDWYREVVERGELLGAARNSAVVALTSSTIATALGTMVALLLARFRFRGQQLLGALALLPLIVPYVVLGFAMLILFSALGVQRSLVTVAAGHVVLALPFVVLIVLARLVGFDAALEDAAMDLGATYRSTLRLVVLPIVAPAIVAAWLVAFTVSFDEVALALFLTGREQTFPVYLVGSIRFTGSLPYLIAGAVLLMLATVTVAVTAQRLLRRDR
jgi:spermidine/putrescine transport system permease protein